MKLLHIIQARSVWLFPINDLNPRGRGVERDASKALAERYKFAGVPDAAAILQARKDNKGIVYQEGIYQSPHGDPINVALTIYTDGLVADTRSSTTDSDHFLNDLLTWLSTDFGLLPHNNIVRRKLYISDMHVRFEQPLTLINPKLEEFCRTMADKSQNQAPGITFEVGAIGFWNDPATQHRIVNFRLERAEGVPFSENRFFTQAPIHTHEHLELLEKLEHIVSS